MSTLLRILPLAALAISALVFPPVPARADPPVDVEWIRNRIASRGFLDSAEASAHFLSLADEIRGSPLALNSFIYFLRSLGGEVTAEERESRGLPEITFNALTYYVDRDPRSSVSFLYLAMQAELLAPESFSLVPFFEAYFHETIGRSLLESRWIPDVPEEVSKRTMAALTGKILRKSAKDLQDSYSAFYREVSEAATSRDPGKATALVERKRTEMFGGLRRYFLSDRFSPLPFQSSEAAAVANAEMRFVLALDLAEDPKFSGIFRERFLHALRATKEKTTVFQKTAFEGSGLLIARIRPLRERDPEIDYWVKRCLIPSGAGSPPARTLTEWVHLLFDPSGFAPGSPEWTAFARFIDEFKATIVIESEVIAFEADPELGAFARRTPTDFFLRYTQPLHSFDPANVRGSTADAFRRILAMLQDPAGPYRKKNGNGDFAYPRFREYLLNQAMAAVPRTLISPYAHAAFQQTQDLGLVSLRILVDEFQGEMNVDRWKDALSWLDQTERSASIVLDGVRYEANAHAIYMKAFAKLHARMRAPGADPGERNGFLLWLFNPLPNGNHLRQWGSGGYLRMRMRDQLRDRLFAAVPPPPPELVAKWGVAIRERLVANIQEIRSNFRLSPATPIEEAIGQQTTRLAQIAGDFRFIAAHRREFAPYMPGLVDLLDFNLAGVAKAEVLAVFAPEIYAEIAQNDAGAARLDGEVLESLVVFRARLDGNGRFSASAARVLYERLSLDLAALGAHVGGPSEESLKWIAEQCELLSRKAE